MTAIPIVNTQEDIKNVTEDPVVKSKGGYIQTILNRMINELYEATPVVNKITGTAPETEWELAAPANSFLDKLTCKVEENPVTMTIGTTSGATDIMEAVTLPVGRNHIHIEYCIEGASSIFINISGGWLSKIRVETVIDHL